MINTIKYAAFNDLTKSFYLCTTKQSLAKYIGCSVATIRRKESITSSFTIYNWFISVNVDINKLNRGGKR